MQIHAIYTSNGTATMNWKKNTVDFEPLLVPRLRPLQGEKEREGEKYRKIMLCKCEGLRGRVARHELCSQGGNKQQQIGRETNLTLCACKYI